MQVVDVPLEELVALSLRSLRRAPTGLAALLSGVSSALGASLVGAYLIPPTGTPELLATAGSDGPSLSQRTGEDHGMLRALALQLEARAAEPETRSGIWTEYGNVASVSSCLDEKTTCVLVAAGDSSVDLEVLRRISAPVTVLSYVIAQDRNSRELRRYAIETDQEMSLLVAGLHHDLKTPLTGILGSARTLIDRGDRVSAELREELLEGIARQTERLTRMVTDTLDRDRDRDRPVTPSSVNLRDLTERAAAAAMMGRTGSVVVEAPDSEIRTDADRLERALLNLLDNALKYTPTGEPVYVIAESQEDGWTRVTTADQGPGVAHDVLPRLFDPYVSDAGRGDGTGLGLNSAKRAIERDLGGLLSYTRHQGWTRFVISIPTDGSEE